MAKIPDQDELAWDLLDAVRAGLDPVAINRVSMTMADRDYPAAIEILLTAVATGGDGTLSGDLRERLRAWAGFYAALPLSARLIGHLDAEE